MDTQDIYSFIEAEETAYEQPIQVVEGLDWNMKEHVNTTILYKNSSYLNGKDDNKPFKNIIRPILNLQYRTEGFDVKDIVLYVDEKDSLHTSFLTKKYHEKWARENSLDTFIDNMVESYVDFGGVLVKKTDDAVPEVVPMASLAFVDQTDILSGPIAIKHFFAPDQLKEMEKNGWGDTANGANISVDELIELCEKSDYGKVKDSQDGQISDTPGKYIEIYEVHGVLPERYLDEDVDYDNREFVRQIQIVGFYSSDGVANGVTLYKKEEKKTPFKLLLRDGIYGRALGQGGAEELFEAQVWTNYGVIREKEMLDSASKTIFKTDDPTFENRNKLDNLDNNEILVLKGGDISQLDTFPRNIALFDKSVTNWEDHARQMGAANDVSLGESPKSGTPFRLQALVTREQNSLHKYRQGKIATFLGEVYDDWILPYISREITKDQEFLAELDLREMQDISETVANNTVNKATLKRVLSGQMILPEEMETLKAEEIEKFKKNNKKFIKILKDDIKGKSLAVKVNIVGKQEYLAERVDKIVNVIQAALANPQMFADPSFNELTNQVLEGSGFSPVDFSGLKALAAQQAVAPKSAPPLQLTPPTQQ